MNPQSALALVVVASAGLAAGLAADGPFSFEHDCIGKERVSVDNRLGGHEAVVADVDGDGVLDICRKLWHPRQDKASGGRSHADFLENLPPPDARLSKINH